MIYDLSQSRRLPPLSGGEWQQIYLSGSPISDWDKRSARMRSDSVKNMSAYADQNHAPSLTDVRLVLFWTYFVKSIHFLIIRRLIIKCLTVRIITLNVNVNRIYYFFIIIHDGIIFRIHLPADILTGPEHNT